MTISATGWWGRYPVAPFIAFYVLGLLLAAVGNDLYEPARFVAGPLMWIGLLGVMVVGALLLAKGGGPDRRRPSAAFVGGLVTAVFQLWAVTYGDDIEAGLWALVWVLGWVLMAIGASAPGRPAHQHA